MDIDVVHQPSAHRYIVTVDGAEAGEASYMERDNELLITHTFIDPALWELPSSFDIDPFSNKETIFGIHQNGGDIGTIEDGRDRWEIHEWP
jgi:hypothetical protein